MANKEQPLTWTLADEGMDLLERAGLAGLYMALHAAQDAGVDLSPLLWDKADLTPKSVTVRWTGTAERAFSRLMAWAWQAKDGVLFLPGIHADRELSQWWLRVPTHNGIMRTFLQHNRVQPRGDVITKISRLVTISPKPKGVEHESIKKITLPDGCDDFPEAERR